jgi:phage protein D
MLARRAYLTVDYSGVDISKEVSADLLSFTYTDNASGEADNISISLKDEKKKWGGPWFPTKGDVINASIHTLNWRKDGDKQKLPCGRFFVDEPGYSGRPRVMTIDAISAPLDGNFSDTERSRSWRNITLKAIANDIAKRAGLSLQCIGKNNPKYSNIQQSETADSAFLSDLCEKAGLAMKVTDSKIVIFDEEEFEKRPSIATYEESNDSVKSYSFKTSLSHTAYAGVNVKYYDAKLGRKIEFLYAVRDIEKGKDKVYQLNAKVKTGEEARKLAQKTLRKLNKKEYTATISVVGNIELLGGSCIDLKSFGAFDGKYYIEKATHNVGSGYTTDLELRKVLEGY